MFNACALALAVSLHATPIAHATYNSAVGTSTGTCVSWRSVTVQG